MTGPRRSSRPTSSAARAAKATPGAVRALVEAVGKDLREPSAACAQLIADTEGLVDEAAVEKYQGGKVEATVFKVADAAIAGNAGEALRLVRHAIPAGDSPVPIVGVLAMQLRQIVKVANAGRWSLSQLGQVPRDGAVADRPGLRKQSG